MTLASRSESDTNDVRIDRELLARVQALNAVAEDLAGEPQLHSLLERILRRCMALMACDAGSIAIVDEVNGHYYKEVDIGIRCQSGQVFSLDEGMTGEVVRRRAPVWFDRYEDVSGGHINAEDARTLKGVIGVPLEWRGRVIGACIVFSRDSSRQFTSADANLLRLFGKHAAIAVANAQMYEATEERARAQAASAERDRILDEVHGIIAQGSTVVLGRLKRAQESLPDDAGEPIALLQEAQHATVKLVASIRHSLLGAGSSPLEHHSLEEVLDSELNWAEKARGLDTRFVVSGSRKALAEPLANDILTVAHESIANVVQHAAARSVRMGLVYDSASVSLIIEDDGQGFDARDQSVVAGLGHRRIMQRALQVGGSAKIDSVPGWGTTVRAQFPYRRLTEAAGQLEVVVFAPNVISRAGLARLLTWSDPAISVVREVATTAEAIDLIRDVAPTVLVVDVAYRCGLVDVVQDLRNAQPRTAIVTVCDEIHPEAVSEILLAGARCCVDADCDGGSLAHAVVAAARGESLLPSLSGWQDRLLSGPNPDNLTARELQVRALVEEGLRDKAIAEKLVLSVKTVEKHVGSVLKKTGAKSRVELIARARNRVDR
jgi:DNA-binding NarL/FixJ family response regulator/signal transduction histidine kinase